MFGVCTPCYPRSQGKFYLEDLDGAVELQLRDSNYTSGLFTENCIVVAEVRRCAAVSSVLRLCPNHT